MNRLRLVALALLALHALGACTIEHVQEAPPPSHGGQPPAGEPAPDATAVRVAGAAEAPGRFEGALPGDGSAVGATAVLAQGARLSISVSSAGRSELVVYGPLAQRGWSGAPVIARGAVYVDVAIPADGTYLFAVVDHERVPSSFSLEIACTSGECRLECGPAAECPVGAGCALVQCIRAPCPSYCAANVEDAPTHPPSDSPAAGGEGATCGTRGAPPCGPGLTCIHPEGASCGETDIPGTCQAPRQACTREYAPVCGCDGATYPNPCTANASGVSIRHRGACAGTSP